MRPIEALEYPVELLLVWRAENSSAALANFVQQARLHTAASAPTAKS
jgi:hypothetical protein